MNIQPDFEELLRLRREQHVDHMIAGLRDVGQNHTWRHKSWRMLVTLSDAKGLDHSQG